MIAQLTGTLLSAEGNSIIVDVGGVGYHVFVPVNVLTTLPETGSKVTLATHLIIGAKTPEMTLYGFRATADLRAFKLLISTSGVGPKVALALLSTLDVSELARALSTNDTRAITVVPGVGPKLAQRLCLELGDKMAAFAFEQKAARAEGGKQTAAENAAHDDVVEALVGLGYSRADGKRAADRVSAAAPDRADTASLITAALKLLTSRS